MCGGRQKDCASPEVRGFYDALFLLAQTKPDYQLLGAKSGVHSAEELKVAVGKILKTVDLNQKIKDFVHLLFNKSNAARILHIGEFVQLMGGH